MAASIRTGFCVVSRAIVPSLEVVALIVNCGAPSMTEAASTPCAYGGRPNVTSTKPRLLIATSELVVPPVGSARWAVSCWTVKRLVDSMLGIGLTAPTGPEVTNPSGNRTSVRPGAKSPLKKYR